VDTGSGGLCRLSELVFEFDRADHTDGRVRRWLWTRPIQSPTASLAASTRWATVAVIELDFDCGPGIIRPGCYPSTRPCDPQPSSLGWPGEPRDDPTYLEHPPYDLPPPARGPAGQQTTARVHSGGAYWAVDDAVTLAKTLRPALDATSQQSPLDRCLASCRHFAVVSRWRRSWIACGICYESASASLAGWRPIPGPPR